MTFFATFSRGHSERSTCAARWGRIPIFPLATSFPPSTTHQLMHSFRQSGGQLNIHSLIYPPLLTHSHIHAIQHVHPPRNPSVHLSTHPSPSEAYLPIVPRTHLSIYFLIHPSTIHSYTHPFIHSSIHPTIYSSIHLSIHQSNRHHFLFFH